MKALDDAPVAALLPSRYRAAFDSYLSCLVHPCADAARAVWTRAALSAPNLRLPSAGEDADGDYYFDWNFVDLHGVTLSVTFARDGRFEWFFRDKRLNMAVGSEEPVTSVPDEVFECLKKFA